MSEQASMDMDTTKQMKPDCMLDNATSWEGCCTHLPCEHGTVMCGPDFPHEQTIASQICSPVYQCQKQHTRSQDGTVSLAEGQAPDRSLMAGGHPKAAGIFQVPQHHAAVLTPRRQALPIRRKGKCCHLQHCPQAGHQICVCFVLNVSLRLKHRCM